MVKTNKIIGQISDEILEKYNICMFRNTQIIQPSGLYKHISKHIDEFENIETYNYVVSNLSWIISAQILFIMNYREIHFYILRR